MTSFEHFAAAFLSHVMPWMICVWAAYRASYMNARTSHWDRVALVLLGAGAFAEGLMPLYREYESWIDAVFFAGVAMWCIAPSVRSAVRERSYRRRGDTRAAP